MTSPFLLISLLLLPAISGLTVSDFIERSSACASSYSCKDSNASGGSVSKCSCDTECITYGDCCYDAPTYNRSEQIENMQKWQCIYGSYMMTTCPEEWTDSDVDMLCRSHSPLDIASSKEPILHLPVTSKTKNVTYSNYYCALCHSDVDNITPWKTEMQCFFPSNNKTLQENTARLQSQLNVHEIRDSLTLQESTDHQADGDKSFQFIKSNLKFHDKRKRWLIMDSNNSDVIVECSFKLAHNTVRPENLCSPSINTCAANWTNEEVEDLCLSLSAPVEYYSTYNEILNDSGIIYAETSAEPITYRNMYCAECNHNSIKSPCMIFDQEDTRSDYFPVPPLTILLHIPIGIQRKNLHANVDCKDDEIFKPFSNSHDCILCLTTSEQYIEGECIAKKDNISNSDYGCSEMTFGGKDENETVYNQNTSSCIGDKSTSKNELCGEFLIWNNNFLSNTHSKMVLLDDLEVRAGFNNNYETMLESPNHNSSKTHARRECLPNSSSFLLSVISLVSLLLSIVSITLHLIAFLLVKKLRNLPGINLTTLCCFLLMGYIAFLVSPALEPQTPPCYLVACAIYFCFIGSFCWMNVIAFDTWKSFKEVNAASRLLESRKLYRMYSLVSWSLSIIAVALLVAVDKIPVPGIPKSLLPKLGEYWCWFGQRLSLFLFFVVPMMVSSISILVFFIRTSLLISKGHQDITSVLGCQGNRDLFRAYRRLGISMGLTWVTALVAGFVKNPFVWFVFILFNGLQGVLIFGTFTCRKVVWERIAMACKCGKIGEDHRSNRPRRDPSVSEHQRKRIELLHVSTYLDTIHQPSRVNGIFNTQVV
ncbi:uncharacterized protein [Palaemon carinicauda]|uniref:uncharacterized protein n=1 Tax=Palaemon carinicauda TaxID=392227 RepID=UPI0035B65D54